MPTLSFYREKGLPSNPKPCITAVHSLGGCSVDWAFPAPFPVDSGTSFPCTLSIEVQRVERRARRGPGAHLHLLCRPWTRFFSKLPALNSRAKPAVRNVHRTFKWMQSRQHFSVCTSCIIIVAHGASTIYPWATLLAMLCIRFRDDMCHLYPNKEKTDLVSKPELKLKNPKWQWEPLNLSLWNDIFLSLCSGQSWRPLADHQGF